MPLLPNILQGLQGILAQGGENPLDKIPKMGSQPVPELSGQLGSQGAMEFLQNRPEPQELPEIQTPQYAQDLIANPPRSEALSPIQGVYKDFLNQSTDAIPANVRALAGMNPDVAQRLIGSVDFQRSLGTEDQQTYRDQLGAATDLGKSEMFGNLSRNKSIAERDAHMHRSDTEAVTGIRGAEAGEYTAQQGTQRENIKGMFSEQIQRIESAAQLAINSGNNALAKVLAGHANKLKERELAQGQQRNLIEATSGQNAGMAAMLQKQAEAAKSKIRQIADFEQWTDERLADEIGKIDTELDTRTVELSNRFMGAVAGKELAPVSYKGFKTPERGNEGLELGDYKQMLDAAFENAQEPGFVGKAFGETAIDSVLANLPDEFSRDDRLKELAGRYLRRKFGAGSVAKAKAEASPLDFLTKMTLPGIVGRLGLQAAKSGPFGSFMDATKFK